MQKRTKYLLIFAAILLVAAGGVYYAYATRNLISTDDATVEAHVAALSAKVSGYVAEVDFEDNQVVKKDDVLLRLNPIDYQIVLDQKKAAMVSAEAKLASGQEGYVSAEALFNSQVASAHASLASAEANEQKARADLQRLQSLNPAAYARQDMDAAVAAEKSAQESVNSARANLRSAEAAPHTIEADKKFVESMAADVDRAGADVAQAEKNIADTTLAAPFDGRITKRNVEPGNYAQPGQQLLTLVSNDHWVIADFKENQITHMRPGQKADIKIDAYPKHTFHGTVDSLQSGTGARFSLFPPENATGNFVKIVQRVPVKIVFTDPPDPKYDIGPGLSVDATVHVE